MLHYLLFLYYTLNFQYPNNWFYKKDLKKVLSKIKTTIIHGRLDLTCPPEGVFLYKKHYPQTNIIMVEDAGHVFDPNKAFENTTKSYFNEIL